MILSEKTTMTEAVIKTMAGLRLDSLGVTALVQYGNRLRGAFHTILQVTSKMPELAPWDVTPLEKYGEKLRSVFHKGIEELANKAFPRVLFESLPERFGFGTPGVYGPDTQMHAFRHLDYQRGFCLLEPQLTKMLKHFLDPETAGRDAGIIRSRAFVTALFRASGLYDDCSEFEFNKETHTLRVFAEKDNIDLLFECWDVKHSGTDDTPQCHWVIAVENKLGHHLTKKQLQQYEGTLQKRFKNNKNRMKLFVLARDFGGKNAEVLGKKRNQNWFAVTWWGLLRHWEQSLDEADFEDKDKDFPCLRRTMWTLGVWKK